jgi:hypothetical protein
MGCRILAGKGIDARLLFEPGRAAGLHVAWRRRLLPEGIDRLCSDGVIRLAEQEVDASAKKLWPLSYDARSCLLHA